ncbi:MAG: imidazole glycerol phosphate synthase subunit HisF [Planctomycetes bacterium]|nr:imidazole glycerol phosphate synthase subunit HisF [Planctomycetota bacterium]
MIRATGERQTLIGVPPLGINFVDLKDAGDPVECARTYDEQGADELIFLDITATHENRETTLNLARECAEALTIPFTIGGGVRSVNDFEILLRAGADKVAMNSAAVNKPELIKQCATQFGVQAVVVAVDARRVGDGWTVHVKGGREDTGLDALGWIKKVEQLGAGEIMLTSMDRDGTGEGFDLELTKLASETVNIPIIASGGVGELQHLADGLNSGAQAVLAAGIFHFGKFSIGQAREFLLQQGINVRPLAEAQ